jgi:hypothetical protein
MSTALHSPVHIEICAGGCNAVDGEKDKLNVDLFLSKALTKGSFNNEKKKGYQSDRRKSLANMGLAGAAILAAPALNPMASDSDVKWGEEHEIV